MKDFKEIKEEIIKRAKLTSGCEEQYERAYKSENINELLNMVKDNLRWVYKKMNINVEFLEEYFGIEILKENHIYTSGENSIELNNVNKHIYVLGNAFVNVKTRYNSSVNIETWNKSSANINVFYDSFANVKTWDNSSVNVKVVYDSSANVKTYHESFANVDTWNNSSANVKTCDNSSKLTFKVIGEDSFIRHHNERKIYVKKDIFETVEL